MTDARPLFTITLFHNTGKNTGLKANFYVAITGLTTQRYPIPSTASSHPLYNNSQVHSKLASAMQK